MKYPRFACAIFLCMIICACSSAPTNAPDVSPVRLTNFRKFYLLPTECVQKDTDSLALLSGGYKDFSFAAQAFITANRSLLSLYLLNEFGTTMGTLDYDGKTIAGEFAMLSGKLQPEYLAADMQLCLYQPEALQKELKRIGLTLECIEAADGVELRHVLRKKKLLIEIQKSAGEIAYTNHLRGYYYTITGDF